MPRPLALPRRLVDVRNAETFFLDLDNGTLRIKALDQLAGDFVELKTDSQALSISVQKLLTDGITSVTTTTGYRFDGDGLWISRLGHEISNRLDHTGMYVSRGADVVLQANADGVEAENIKVRKYLIVGAHARFEYYSDGTDDKRTGCFWI